MTTTAPKPVHTEMWNDGGAANARTAFSRRTIANAVPYLLPVLASLPPTFLFLDVGCGPGSITLDAAARYPHATVLGVDSGAGAIEMARAAAREAGLKNVAFAVGDALGLDALSSQPGFEVLRERGGADIVHAHQVAQHVRDPVALIASMRSAATPNGGYVCLRETDWGMQATHPSSPGLEAFHNLYPPIAAKMGTDPCIGRKLVAHALAAGFRRDEVTGSLDASWTFAQRAQREEWVALVNESLADRGARAFMEGQGVSVDWEGIRGAWSEWLECDEAWHAVPCPQIVCRRVK